MKRTGIAFIIIGLLLTIVTGFGFITKKKVVDVGNLEITKDKKHDVNWPPYVGIGIIVVGGVLVVLGAKKGA